MSRYTTIPLKPETKKMLEEIKEKYRAYHDWDTLMRCAVMVLSVYKPHIILAQFKQPFIQIELRHNLTREESQAIISKELDRQEKLNEAKAKELLEK